MKIKACSAAIRGALMLGVGLAANSAFGGYDVYSEGDTEGETEGDMEGSTGGSTEGDTGGEQ